MALIDDAVGAWKLDETSGNLVDEVSSITLTPNGTPLYNQTGIIGGAIASNSNDDFFSKATATSALAFGATSDFSVNLWVYITSTSGAFPTIFTSNNHANEAATDTYQIFKGNNGTSNITWRTATSGAGVTLESSDLSLNTWHMVTCQRSNSGADFHLYIDNSLEDSKTGQSTQNANAANLRFLSPETDRQFPGRLDLVNVFDVALSSQNRIDLFNSGAAFDYPFSVAVTKNAIAMGHNF